MQEATVSVEVLPEAAGPFHHPEIGDGTTMLVNGIVPDEATKTATVGLSGPGSWPPKVGVIYPDE